LRGQSATKYKKPTGMSSVDQAQQPLNNKKTYFNTTSIGYDKIKMQSFDPARRKHDIFKNCTKYFIIRKKTFPDIEQRPLLEFDYSTHIERGHIHILIY